MRSPSATSGQAGKAGFAATVCGRIQERRAAVGVTWRELVAASGIPETRMRQGTVTLDDLTQLEAPLGCSALFLLCGDETALPTGRHLRAI